MNKKLPRLPLTSTQNALLLLVLFLGLRMFHLHSPLVDHHSWNQVSAAAMAKHIYYDWGAVFYPTVDLYNNTYEELAAASTQPLNRIYAQEFPLYHLPIAWIYSWSGVQEWPGRMVSICYGLLGLWYLFLLTQHLWGGDTALLTLLIAGISPLNWYFQRTIMSDTSMVTAMIAGFYYFYRWLEDQPQEKYFWYALLWTMAAGVFKAFGLVIGVAYLALILLRKEYTLLKRPKLYLFAALAWSPTLIWIYHVVGLNLGRTEFSKVDKMLSVELWWDWQFYKRIIFARLIDQLLTPWMAIFGLIGMGSCRFSDKRFHPPLAWMAACLVYLFLVQKANYIHDYYQLPFVPGLSLFAALGIRHIWKLNIKIRWRSLWLGSFFLLFFIQSAIYTHNHLRLDRGSYQTGKKIAELSQTPDDRVLALDPGASKRNQLIYYSKRTGWFVKELNLKKLETFRAYGVQWLGVNLRQDPHFAQHQSVLKQIEQTYPKVWEDRNQMDRYGRPVISQVYDLRRPLSLK